MNDNLSLTDLYMINDLYNWTPHTHTHTHVKHHFSMFKDQVATCTVRNIFNCIIYAQAYCLYIIFLYNFLFHSHSFAFSIQKHICLFA